MRVRKHSIRLHAIAKAVITSFLSLPGNKRIPNIIQRIKHLTEEETEASLKDVISNFAHRHRDIDKIFLTHFNRINNQYRDDLLDFSHNRKLLLGAYFTKEYSIQAAALFNPSIVPHPDQENLHPGELRFIMSLRATGEGHISSIVFKTGIVDDQANITLDESSRYSTCLNKNEHAVYTKTFIREWITGDPDFTADFVDGLPESYTAADALRIVGENKWVEHEPLSRSIEKFKQILDSNYELETYDLPLQEIVIFPTSNAESMGMEDVRFVRFQEENFFCYYGTYTAYDGHHIKTQLIETRDFNIFTIRTLYGSAVSDKGMALFPEKIDGKYVMISRQGGETINIMFSENLYCWDTFHILMEPKYTWEMVQLGNCGSPLKTDKGWLLLTHGVGAMRTYVISAVLLDLYNPSVITGRLTQPLIEADESEREGYVPNVVYTCGLLRHGDLLLIPYAVSDSATGFVTVSLPELLIELTTSNS